MRSDRERLIDIREAIDRIEKYTAQGRPHFDADELVQTWIVHHLQIIGEAAAAISEAFQSSHPEAPWREIIGMRNVLVHGYFDIDRDIVWATAAQDLAPLKATIDKWIADS